jgi:hypothetical protein
MLKTIVRVGCALLISLLLTIVCVAFTSRFFMAALTTTFELLPPYQFLNQTIHTKAALFQHYQIEELAESSESNFLTLRKVLPDNRDKSVFFANMFVVQDYPKRCQYTLIGVHKTLDVAWQVTGLRCGNKQSCQQALVHEVCKDRKEPKHERHH